MFRDMAICSECNEILGTRKRRLTLLEQTGKDNLFRMFCNFQCLVKWVKEIKKS